MFVRQSEMLIPEEELGSQSQVSYEEDFEDLSSNVDLYVFNDQMVQGYRGVNINSRHNEEPLGEMYRKDHYIDVSNQENTAPVYHFQLSAFSASLLLCLVQTKTKCRWSILDVVL